MLEILQKVVALLQNTQFTNLHCLAWRMIEDQHHSSTRKLVDSLEEHDILEQLIDTAKPPLADQYQHLDYLLATPFRYPPLNYGSRFGSRFEPSLWYGSLRLDTVLAEKAFYQFYFIKACQSELNIIERVFTLFKTKIKTQSGINLTEGPFKSYTGYISSPHHYQISQRLGLKMRELNVDAFLYQSARCHAKGTNIGLFSANAFESTKPESDTQSWRATCQHNVIEFTRNSINNDTRIFSIEDFLIDNELPLPPH